MGMYKDSVMILAEQNNGRIHPISYELLAKGQQIAAKKRCPLVAVLIGTVDDQKADLNYYGADMVVCVEHPKWYDLPEENIYAQTLYQVVKKLEPAILLVGATNFGRSLAPKTAALLGCGLTADCIELDVDEDGGLIQIRPAFSENILAHIKSRQYPQMATVRYKEFSKGQPDYQRPVKQMNVTIEIDNQTKVKVIEQVVVEQVDLANAQVVISGGRGLRESEDFKLLHRLAEKIPGAVVGSSRPMVEEGYISKAHQVGYSGHRVKPRLYVACGISGAPQHLAGMKQADYIIAINKDPSAPIFQVADVGIVGDLYEIVPELIKELEG